MDKIPLPTDNIYKFYALFGLLLIAISIGAMVVIGQKQNDALMSVVRANAAKPQGEVQQRPLYGPGKREPTDEERMMEAIWRKLELQYNGLLFVLLTGVVLSMFGFGNWHRMVQPIQDEMLVLQLQKLRLEVAALQPTAGAASTRQP